MSGRIELAVPGAVGNPPQLDGVFRSRHTQPASVLMGASDHGVLTVWNSRMIRNSFDSKRTKSGPESCSSPYCGDSEPASFERDRELVAIAGESLARPRDAGDPTAPWAPWASRARIRARSRLRPGMPPSGRDPTRLSPGCATWASRPATSLPGSHRRSRSHGVGRKRCSPDSTTRGSPERPARHTSRRLRA